MGVLPNMVGESAYVMIRVYQLAETHKDFIQDITYATNRSESSGPSRPTFQ